MKYINANAILPDMLVKELQKYVQAGYIYIPAKGEQHKSWIKLLLKSIGMVFRLKSLLMNTTFWRMP